MTKIIELKNGVQKSIHELLSHLLESGKVQGVFTLKQLKEDKSGKAISYSLITKTKGLEEIIPFYPVMPRNAGGLLSTLTLKGNIPGPLAVIARPCEIRAFIELVKRNRGKMDNLVFISSTCGGVYPTKKMINGDLTKEISEYWQCIKKNETPKGIRSSCSSCSEFIPYNSDISFIMVGGGDIDKQSRIILNTTKAEELINEKDLKGKIVSESIPEKIISSIKDSRENYKNDMFKKLNVDSMNLQGLVNTFGKCIGCRGCRTACPICYCELCTFDSQSAQTKINQNELTRKGGIRVPSGTVYYHMTRLPHVTISCVGCGSCEDACPMEIPLFILFKKVGEDVQAVFNYLPGKNLDEKLPIKTFEIDEHTKFED